jgi:PAS domain S-box-containing protein
VNKDEQPFARKQKGETLSRFTLLSKISGELLRSDNPQRVIQNLCEQVMMYLDCHTFLNYLTDESGCQLTLHAFAGISEEDARLINRLEYGEAICGCVARYGTRIIVENPDSFSDKRDELIRSYNIKAYACHPLFGTNGKTIGTLSFGTRTRDVFNYDDLDFMKAVADQVAVAMIRIYSDQKLRRYYDELEKLVEERMTEFKKSEERLSVAIEATGGGIFEICLNPENTCFFSERWFEIFGLPKISSPECREMKKMIGEMIHPDEYEKVDESFYEFVAGSVHTFSTEMRVKKKSGEWIVVQIMAHAAQRHENGRVLRLVGVILDITQRKRLEEQLLHSQKMESLGRLAGGVAHDFNNMLQVITACSYRMMKSVEPDSALSKDIEAIREAAQSSARLSHRLLAFSSKQMLQPRMVCINQLVWRVHKLLSNSLRENVRVSLMLNDSTGNVFIDQVQLEQTIINMVMNAQNAITGSGRIDITTSKVMLSEVHPHTRDVVPAGPYVMVAITDNGCGIDNDVINNIFDPFFTTRSMEGGNGLGLSSAYAIVKQSGGVIRVYSTPGQGSTFKIFLPWKEKNEIAVRSEKMASEVINCNTTALVVDDNLYALRFVVNGLKDLGCKVLEARNGQEALDIFHSYTGNIDVLITDIVMPGLSGVEIAKIIRREKPGIALLYMSGFQAGQLAHHYDPSEGIVLLSKPFSMEDLWSALLQACSASVGKLKKSITPRNHDTHLKNNSIQERSIQKKILIVDDEKISAECLASLIRKCGYVVEIAEDGCTAISLAESFTPDVIIMDIRLPDMDGYKLAEQIRALPFCSQTTMIGCSGSSPIEEKMGLFDTYLIKPLDMMALMQLLSGDALPV